jgi:hypothetical protein
MPVWNVERLTFPKSTNKLTIDETVKNSGAKGNLDSAPTMNND